MCSDYWTLLFGNSAVQSRESRCPACATRAAFYLITPTNFRGSSQSRCGACMASAMKSSSVGILSLVFAVGQVIRNWRCTSWTGGLQMHRLCFLLEEWRARSALLDGVLIGSEQCSKGNELRVGYDRATTLRPKSLNWVVNQNSNLM